MVLQKQDQQGAIKLYFELLYPSFLPKDKQSEAWQEDIKSRLAAIPASVEFRDETFVISAEDHPHLLQAHLLIGREFQDIDEGSKIIPLPDESKEEESLFPTVTPEAVLYHKLLPHKTITWPEPKSEPLSSSARWILWASSHAHNVGVQVEGSANSEVEVKFNYSSMAAFAAVHSVQDVMSDKLTIANASVVFHESCFVLRYAWHLQLFVLTIVGNVLAEEADRQQKPMVFKGTYRDYLPEMGDSSGIRYFSSEWEKSMVLELDAINVSVEFREDSFTLRAEKYDSLLRAAFRLGHCEGRMAEGR